MIRSYLKRINAKAVLFVLLTVLVVGGFLVALQNLDSGHRKEGKEQLEAAIRRSAVACYAAEGIYPPDIDYLVEHYGIQIDEENHMDSKLHWTIEGNRFTVTYFNFSQILGFDETDRTKPRATIFDP